MSELIPRRRAYSRPLQLAVENNQFRALRHTAVSIPSFAEARSRLPEPYLPQQTGWEEMYWRGWELAWSNLQRPAAGGRFIAPFIDSGANESCSMWSTVFMTQFALYARRAVDFMGMLDNFYARQDDDGYIGRLVDARDGRDLYAPFDPNGTGPNVMAWGEWRYFRLTGNEERLAYVFWPLLGFHRWFRAYRTWPSGLYWATGLSSGMDNQRRVADGFGYHQHWIWVDANMQAVLNCLILEQIATLLEQPEVAAEMAEERSFLAREINARLWDAEENYYKDAAPNGRLGAVKTIGAYWALLTPDLVPEGQLAPFIRHLRETAAFKRPHRVPAQPADSADYDAGGDFWRGGVWSAANFMVLKGLRAIGQHALAHEIAVNHLDNVWSVFQRTNTFWEYYAPESAAAGEGARPNFVGSSGLTPIAILLEDVLGVNVDWPLRRVVWDRRLNGRYGVRRYPLGPQGKMDLIGDEAKVEVTTDAPFTLLVQMASGTVQTAVPAGTTEIDLA